MFINWGCQQLSLLPPVDIYRRTGSVEITRRVCARSAETIGGAGQQRLLDGSRYFHIVFQALELALCFRLAQRRNGCGVTSKIGGVNFGRSRKSGSTAPNGSTK